MISNGSETRLIDAAREMTLALLAERSSTATLCPSEVARALASVGGPVSHWRDAMPLVHAAVDQLLAQAQVRLSWKGEALTTRAGPYRIGRRPADQSG